MTVKKLLLLIIAVGLYVIWPLAEAELSIYLQMHVFGPVPCPDGTSYEGVLPCGYNDPNMWSAGLQRDLFVLSAIGVVIIAPMLVLIRSKTGVSLSIVACFLSLLPVALFAPKAYLAVGILAFPYPVGLAMALVWFLVFYTIGGFLNQKGDNTLDSQEKADNNKAQRS